MTKKAPSEDAEAASRICPNCADRLAAYQKPALVVSRRWARMYEALVEMFKDRPDIQVVLDRREPGGQGPEGRDWNGPERRKKRHALTLE
jgi:hypothetical protein